MAAINWTGAVFDRLNHSSVTTLLGTWTPAGGSARAALFTGEVPGGAGRPNILIGDAIADEPGEFEAKDQEGRAVIVDIICTADNTGSNIPVDRLAEAVRARFYRPQFDVKNFATPTPATVAGVVICRVSGPVGMPTDDNYIGRVVTLAMEISEAV